MKIQEAIKKAVEGGYHKKEQPDLTENSDGCWLQFFGGDEWFEKIN